MIYKQMAFLDTKIPESLQTPFCELSANSSLFMGLRHDQMVKISAPSIVPASSQLTQTCIGTS